jgi:recombination protein RecA
LFIDAEHKLSVDVAKSWGIDPKRCLVQNPIEGEAAIDAATNLINTGAIGIAVLDSVSSLTPSYDLEKDSEKEKPGTHAKLITRAVNKLLTAAVRTNTLLIFINQVRANLSSAFGGLKTAGGYHLEHLTSVKLNVTTKGKASRLYKNGRWYGHRAYIKVDKTQISFPVDREIEFVIEYGKRINKFMEIVLIAAECGLIDKTGSSWFKFQDGLKINGQESAAQYLEDNPALAEELEKKIYEIGTYDPNEVVKEVEDRDDGE